MHKKIINFKKRYFFKVTSLFLTVIFIGTFFTNENVYAAVKPYIITTIAGTGAVGPQTGTYSGDLGDAKSAGLNEPFGVAVDSTGNVYIADSGNKRIREIDKNGKITTIAGGGTDWGDGVPATSAKLTISYGVAVDSAGNVYISDTHNNRIREINKANGKITTIAGTGADLGDGGPATSAKLSLPWGVAVDSTGNVYIADSGNNRIREIYKNGTITTIAGTGNKGSYGDGGLAVSAELSNPTGVAVDSIGNVYIADTDNNRIRKIDKMSGKISTIASNNLDNPYGVAIDSSMNVYFSDTNHSKIYKINASDMSVNVIAGTSNHGFAGNGDFADKAKLCIPTGVAVDSTGNVYIADANNNRIRKLSEASSDCDVTAAASPMGASIDNSANSISAYVDNNRTSLTVDVTTSAGASWKLYSDSGCTREITNKTMSSLALGNNTAYIKVTAQDGITTKVYKLTVRRQSATYIINTIAGTGAVGLGTGTDSGNGGDAKLAGLNEPCGVAVDSTGNVYIADTKNRQIRKIKKADGTITTIVGGSYYLDGVAVDSTGNMYIAMTNDNRIIEVGNSTINTIADAKNAGLNGPQGVAVDSTGNVYIADTNRDRIIEIVNGTINTIADTTSAGLKGPQGVAVDSTGNVYIADTKNHRILKMDKTSGNIKTLASTINTPHGIAVDSSMNVYFSSMDGRIYKVNASDASVNAIAGIDNTMGFAGDGGLADNAEFNCPLGVAVDSTGNVYIADELNNRIRKLSEASFACDVTAAAPSMGASIDNSNNSISASVGNTVTSMTVDVTPSADAAWKLYSDSSCMHELTGNVMSNLSVGANTAYIKVTAQDGTTSQIYTLTVTRAASKACEITRVNVPSGASINGADITANVNNATTSVTVDVTPSADATWKLYSDSNCTHELTGNMMSGLKVGANTSYIKVTAQDVTTSKVYTLTVTRAASTACEVASITTPGGAVILGTNITASVDNATTDMTVNVTPSADATWKMYSDSNCTHELTGNLMSGLAVGANTAYIKVTAQDGTTSKVYMLTVTRAASKACEVASVTTPSGAVILGTDITASVDNAITDITVDVTPSADATWKLYSDSSCMHELTGNVMSNLSVGANTAYIKVTAQDGTTSQIYTLTVTRAASSACKVTCVTTPSGAVINGADITANVNNATTSVKVDVTPSADAAWKLYSDSSCTHELAGNEMSNLKVGDNKAYIKVTAQDGTTSQVYTLTVTRASSTACEVTNVTVPSGASISGTNITANVDNAVTSMTVSVTPSADATWALYSDSNCTHELAGNLMNNLSVGANTAYIKVTAQDGRTSKVYMLTITRAANQYTLSYLTDGNGSIQGNAAQTVNYLADGTSVTAVPKTGYHFVKWSDGNTDIVRQDKSITVSLTVTAEFAINTYTVTFDDYDGTVIGTQTVNYGGSAKAPQSPAKTGYSFANWDKDFSNITSDLTVTAKYTSGKSYTFTGDAASQSTDEAKIVEGYFGSRDNTIIVNNNGVTFTIPADAVDITGISNTGYVKTTAKEVEGNMLTGSLPDNMQIVESPFEFDIQLFSSQNILVRDIHQFANNRNVQVSIKLTGDKLKNLDTSKLSAYYYDESSKTWVLLGGSYNSSTQEFTFMTPHFTKFAIMEKVEAVSKTASSADTNNTQVLTPHKLVQTGSFFDSDMLICIGSILLLAGIILIAKGSMKKSK